MLQRRKLIENCPPSFRITSSRHFVLRFVVKNYAAILANFLLRRQLLSVDNNLIVVDHAVTDNGNLAIDLDAAFCNPGLDFAARTEACTS